MSIDKIDLQIAYGAVKHFGRNLYNSVLASRQRL